MKELIKDYAHLQEILRQHTGSKTVPNSLVYDLQVYKSTVPPNSYYYSPGLPVFYLAYSRGKSTLIFARLEDPSTKIKQSWFMGAQPKILRSGWHDGIDAAILTRVSYIIAAGGKITPGYNGRIHLCLPDPKIHAPLPISEQEIVDILSLGFKSYTGYDINIPDGHFAM